MECLETPRQLLGNGRRKWGLRRSSHETCHWDANANARCLPCTPSRRLCPDPLGLPRKAKANCPYSAGPRCPYGAGPRLPSSSWCAPYKGNNKINRENSKKQELQRQWGFCGASLCCWQWILSMDANAAAGRRYKTAVSSCCSHHTPRCFSFSFLASLPSVC